MARTTRRSSVRRTIACGTGHGTATALAALLIFAAAGGLPAHAQPAASPAAPSTDAPAAPAETPPPVAPPVAALPPPVAPPVAALPAPAAPAPAGSGEAAAEPPMPKESDWVDAPQASPPTAAPATALLAPQLPPALPAAPPGAPPAAPPGAPPPGSASPATAGISPPGGAPLPIIAPPPGVAGQVAAAPQPDLIRIANPVVRDTATLVADGKDVPLYGVGDGRGGDDAAVLQKFINDSGGMLTCRAENGGQDVCMTPDGKDLGKVVLVNGLARVALGAPPAYASEEENAQKSRRGLWADLPPAPERIDHPTLPSTAEVQAPQGTTIRLDGIEGTTGAFASTLQTYIASNGDSITCQQQSPETHVCVLIKDDTDIAKLALVNGMAQTAADAPDEYVIEQDAAKVARRGIWADLPADAVAAAERDEAERRVLIANVNVADDGFSIVDGQPSMLVDGAPVFLVFAGLAGWGYWDSAHHWHGVPADKAKRLDAARPHLRGWSNPSIRQAMAMARPGDFGRGAPVSMSHAPGALATKRGGGHEEAGGRPGVVPASSRPIGGSGHPDVNGKDGREAGGREAGGREAGGREPGGRESGGREPGGREAGREAGGRDASGRETGGREANGRETGGRQEASARPIGGTHPGSGAPMRSPEPAAARPGAGFRPPTAPAAMARPVAAPRPAMPAPRPAPAPAPRKR